MQSPGRDQQPSRERVTPTPLRGGTQSRIRNRLAGGYNPHASFRGLTLGHGGAEASREGAPAERPG